MRSFQQEHSWQGSARGTRRVLPVLLQRGSALLHQQYWLWGCDIRRSEGNLLLEYGFTRQPDPEGNRSTQYTLHLEDGSIVRLWGSGFYFGDASEGIFLNRFAFEPRLARFADEWQNPADLKRAPLYVNFKQLCDICHWTAAYEAWVLSYCDMRYRSTCLLTGPYPDSHPARIAEAWHRLATEFAMLQHF